MNDLHTIVLESEIFEGWFNIHYFFKNISFGEDKLKLKKLILNCVLIAVINNKNVIDISGIFTIDKKEINIPIEVITLIKLML